MMVSINTANCLLGHRNEDSMQKTARELRWTLTCGTIKACEHCAKSKAKQKKVRKETVTDKVTIPRHQLYLDLSKVNVKSGTSKNTTIN